MSRYVSVLCDLCKSRQSRGFGFTPRHLRFKSREPHKMFCSMLCQNLFSKLYQENDEMIDMTDFERECMERTLIPLSEYLMEKQVLGKPIGTMSREIILGMAEIIITSYQDSMIEGSKNARFQS